MNPQVVPSDPASDAAGFTFVGALASLAFVGALAAVAVPLIARRVGPRAPAAAAMVIQRVGTEVTQDLAHIGGVAALYASRLAASLPSPSGPLPAALPDAEAERAPPPAPFWEIPAPPPTFFPRENPASRFWRFPWVGPPPGHRERWRPFGRQAGRRR